MLLSAKVQETQEWASNAAWRMVRENPADTLGIARAGGAGPLVRLLRDTKLPSVKAYALLSLSLAIDEANQSVVAEEGGIEPLVGLLRLPDVTTCEQAACAVQRLALNNADTQKQITKHGAVEPLIALLDSTSTSRSQEYAAAALAQLGTVRVGQLAISLGGGIAPLVNLLCDRHRYPEAKQYAAASLTRLAAETKKESQKKYRRNAATRSMWCWRCTTPRKARRCWRQ